MSEPSWIPDVNWATWEQTRSQVESDVKNKISSVISAYATMCRERGMSSYFVSGLEVAADIAARGEQPKPQGQEETLF